MPHLELKPPRCAKRLPTVAFLRRPLFLQDKEFVRSACIGTLLLLSSIVLAICIGETDFVAVSSAQRLKTTPVFTCSSHSSIQVVVVTPRAASMCSVLGPLQDLLTPSKSCQFRFTGISCEPWRVRFQAMYLYLDLHMRACSLDKSGLSPQTYETV